MLISKKMALKPLLESADGVHLTAYFVNRGKITDLKAQLREAIAQTEEQLSTVMSVEEKTKFLRPLHTLLGDNKIFKQMTGNIGVFRAERSFRVLNIPVEVEQICQVATTFHIKPLIRWLQSDQEFLLLGVEKEASHLYFGSQDSLKLVDSILFPESFKKNSYHHGYISLQESRLRKLKEDETFSWLNEWISQLTKISKPKLFLAGEKALIKSMKRSFKYANTVQDPVSSQFSRNNVGEISSAIRITLQAETKASIEKSLLGFKIAEQNKLTQQNIFQISKAVVKGKVRRLVIAEELNIFGKIDKKSGGLAIHPFDLDHEDDDILDDLAQMVLSQGGEVLVASQSEIPKGRPILAILNKEDDSEAEIDRFFEQHDSFEERLL